MSGFAEVELPSGELVLVRMEEQAGTGPRDVTLADSIFQLGTPAPHALISLVHRGGHNDSDWTKILNYGVAWLSARERVFEMVPEASDGVAAELAEALLTVPVLDDTSRKTVTDMLPRLRDS